MFRLHRISPHENAREPLPDIFGLAKQDIVVRRGQVTLIAAQPNDGKSLLTIWGAGQWAELGLRSLVFSADTDEETSLRRVAASITGKTQDEIEQRMRSGWDDVAESLAKLEGRLAFDFETDPSYQHIYEELVAFWELWGTYPEIVIVDNLMDVAGDNEDEYGGMRDSMRAFKRFARITGAAFIILHHCNESEKRDNHPPARREITGKVAQKPEMILTLQLDGDMMRIACVKNRNGQKDPKGIVHHVLRVDFERVRFFGYNYQPLGA